MAHIAALGFAPFLLLSVAPASANEIVISADDYALGTNLSGMFEGLTISRLTNQPNQNGPDGREAYLPIASDVLIARINTQATIGGFASLLWEYEDCLLGNGTTRTCDPYSVLEIRFDTPTDFIQIDGIHQVDAPDFYAYDSAGNRLNSGVAITGNAYAAGGGYTRLTSGPDPMNPHAYLTSSLAMQRDQSDIVRVVYAGVGGASSARRITYRVPEPSTLLLLSIGALAFRRSREARS